MDSDLDLNKSGALPDGTASANAGGFGAKSADFKRGHMVVDVEKTPQFDSDVTGENQVGDPMKFNPGFLGRPGGWAR